MIIGQYKPFSFLEIYHRSRDEEPMAAGSCSDARDIKMGPARICLFNGSVGIACTCLLKY